jgi:hypothetical protein
MKEPWFSWWHRYRSAWISLAEEVVKIATFLTVEPNWHMRYLVWYSERRSGGQS